MEKLLKKLEKLKLPKKQYAIFGGGPLAIRGLRETNDLDIMVYDELYNEISEKHKNNGEDKIKIDFEEGEIEIYPARNALLDNPEEVIDRAEEINGFKFISLKDSIEWKKKKGREKDLKDVELIEQYLNNEKGSTKSNI